MRSIKKDMALDRPSFYRMYRDLELQFISSSVWAGLFNKVEDQVFNVDMHVVESLRKEINSE